MVNFFFRGDGAKSKKKCIFWIYKALKQISHEVTSAGQVKRKRYFILAEAQPKAQF